MQSHAYQMPSPTKDSGGASCTEARLCGVHPGTGRAGQCRTIGRPSVVAREAFSEDATKRSSGCAGHARKRPGLRTEPPLERTRTTPAIATRHGRRALPDRASDTPSAGSRKRGHPLGQPVSKRSSRAPVQPDSPAGATCRDGQAARKKTCPLSRRFLISQSRARSSAVRTRRS